MVVELIDAIRSCRIVDEFAQSNLAVREKAEALDRKNNDIYALG